jgi:hypothetical protein
MGKYLWTCFIKDLILKMDIHKFINVSCSSCPQVVSGHPGVFWIPWSSQGMTYFLCVFHEQATHTHNCDTVSKSGTDRNSLIKGETR